MVVSDYINLLVAGELKPHSIANIGGEHRDEQQEINVQALIGFLDLANKAIHEKFSLIQKEILLKEFYNNRTYELPGDFTYPVSAELLDGTKVPFNNERRLLDGSEDWGLSLMFPEPYLVLVKGKDFGGQEDISLVYSATPVQVEGVHDSLGLTSSFTQAVLDYVAYRAYIGIDGHIEGVNNTYYLRYLADCNLIKSGGFVASDNLGSNLKLVDRGFV